MDITPIVARLSVIAERVSALKELQSLTYEEFAQDEVLRASVERNFQVAIQAALDIGSILLASLSVVVPSEYKEVFPKLAEVGILPASFAEKLVGMAKFRNVLVHLYLTVDVGKMYGYLQHDLGDLDLFAQYVGKYLTSSADA